MARRFGNVTAIARFETGFASWLSSERAVCVVVSPLNVELESSAFTDGSALLEITCGFSLAGVPGSFSKDSSATSAFRSAVRA